ncbi:iron-containing alcohol dehydrogenase [bacterium]|nr:iron-containing alcohol dehydrogenase [bacterium]
MFETIQFRTPASFFGMDMITKIGPEAKKLGAGKVLIVTGPSVKKAGILDKAMSFLEAEDLSVEVNVQDRDTPEPATDVVEETAEIAKKGDFDVIIGLGGGSIMDVAKMASALMTNPGKTKDYFGKEKVPKRGRPTIMIPTTAGTGAEMTKHAIFLDRESDVKKAVASTNLLPNVAIVDPMLTVTCPPHVTASAGIDAFIHAAEPFISKNANAITDVISLEAVQLLTRWLGPAFSDGQDLQARYYMSLGSLMSGMVLNNAGTSLVHALSYPIGGAFHSPHGVTLSALLATCFEYVVVAKQEKMIFLAEAMGESVEGLSPREAAALAPEAIRHLVQSVGLPGSLRDLGVKDKSNIQYWAEEAHKEQRLLSRSPRTLSVEDIKEIYEKAF